MLCTKLPSKTQAFGNNCPLEFERILPQSTYSQGGENWICVKHDGQLISASLELSWLQFVWPILGSTNGHKRLSCSYMDKPFPRLYSGFPFEEDEQTLYDYGYRVLCTVLVGSGAICVDIIVNFILVLIKRLIRKHLVTEEMHFVVDLLFALINLSVTASLAYMVDGRLRIFWMKRKYGMNNSFSFID